MAGLRFLHTELLRETTVLRTMAKSFLEPTTIWVLDNFRSGLESIGSAQERDQPLELRCLRTKPSKDYEAGRRQGGQDVYAVISGIWKLRPLGSSGPKQEIEFCGIASTKIELYASDEPSTRLAMWRLELGADDAPGCYVHAQILGDSNDPPFPKSVPIPRLPSIFVTPMSAVEFVLGELFQDKWAKETAGNTDAASFWRARQQQRLQSLFSWYQDCLKKAGSSPWMALKEAKPEGGMFLLD